ncbi:MAG TPA: hypothetical protein VE988_06270 [Gemmataceae bacterium]|nr:hypothetical protein [Gemmataceae bacterium]
MQTIRVLEKTGDDGALSLHIPLGRPGVEYEVVVVVQPHAAQATQENGGWPPGYFDKTFGAIDDDTFIRQPQGKLPPPVELD